MYPRPGKIRDRWWGRVDCRGKLSSGLVRPMPVVMDDVLAQGGEEMSFAVNEAVVQTLPARGANPAKAPTSWNALSPTLSKQPSRHRVRRVGSEASRPRRSPPPPCHFVDPSDKSQPLSSGVGP